MDDHFTFLGEVSELEFSPLFEPEGEPNADQSSEGLPGTVSPELSLLP